ncbi:MAG: 1,4-dihydroxy-2-naphthoate polyprenyltransferase [Actinobacteria bacterium]|jgi:1,4-dihydroxy-2-naphthoate octaprenyltransferase|nr:1,4-dihydroxy-2-naphthoate polyprenyltransferase [Actinomycetota bacterium]NCV82344.1 1,4-dihydroxy-2-naphthoate polyprenyltransferase [Actinomycetota bacterium]NCW42665.1 1,4-dihydroxy-2-naphthoate polyprenyltransferase [Actinomycetota bacterium]NCX37305.1 1,4-dihydroxy-2-naphthoate polyprenyltransferase [Actinomycetota bacterium]NCX52168.1 1,4-dihydroxy-2-naphthoate polyprenyltransferase [Actinomycetota bacterium]
MNKWILGARPRTLPAAIAPVFVATALVGSDWNWFRAALALKVGVWLQIGVNYANDYSDGVKGSDDNRIGPTRLVASGLATAAQVKRAAFISFGIASIAGIWLSLLSSPWLMVVGVAAIAAAWGYTGGKNPYGYSGLGEVSVFVFFGLTATIGTFYSQTGRITALSILCAVPMGALSCAILVVNNIRDRAQDELVGKRTLAVRVGDSKARKGFVALLAIAHISALATLLPSSLLTLAVLPLTISLSRAVLSGESGPSLIPLLGKTGKLQMFFGALFALALAIQ